MHGPDNPNAGRTDPRMLIGVICTAHNSLLINIKKPDDGHSYGLGFSTIAGGVRIRDHGDTIHLCEELS
jgi:hypothetical protein